MQSIVIHIDKTAAMKDIEDAIRTVKRNFPDNDIDIKLDNSRTAEDLDRIIKLVK